MRLVALVERPDHVCCRYRLAAYRPYLEAAGYSLELRPFPGDWWSRLRMGRGLENADAVILQRRLLPGWLLFLLRRSCRRLIFDFDDAVFLRDSYSTKGLRSLLRHRRFAATVRAADAVVAGNAFLAGEARRWTDASRVHVIPTCVDPRRYPMASPARQSGGVQLVWVGSSSTLNGLQALTPSLERLGAAIAGLRLKLVCDRFFTLRHLPIDAVPWSEASEPAEIATADIGISHLPDDDWSRGKCGLKVLQYLAAGLPVVSNPVGVQAQMVRPGENGFLVETPADWEKAVRTLAGDADLRRRMGQVGRRRVEREFSVAGGARAWRGVLEQTLPRRVRAG